MKSRCRLKPVGWCRRYVHTAIAAPDHGCRQCGPSVFEVVARPDPEPVHEIPGDLRARYRPRRRQMPLAQSSLRSTTALRCGCRVGRSLSCSAFVVVFLGTLRSTEHTPQDRPSLRGEESRGRARARHCSHRQLSLCPTLVWPVGNGAMGPRLCTPHDHHAAPWQYSITSDRPAPPPRVYVAPRTCPGSAHPGIMPYRTSVSSFPLRERQFNRRRGLSSGVCSVISG